jgi:hypothetical protein
MHVARRDVEVVRLRQCVEESIERLSCSIARRKGSLQNARANLKDVGQVALVGPVEDGVVGKVFTDWTLSKGRGARD